MDSWIDIPSTQFHSRTYRMMITSVHRTSTVVRGRHCLAADFVTASTRAAKMTSKMNNPPDLTPLTVTARCPPEETERSLIQTARDYKMNSSGEVARGAGGSVDGRESRDRELIADFERYLCVLSEY